MIPLASIVLAVIGLLILVYVRWIKKDKWTRLTAIGAILFIQLILFAGIQSIKDVKKTNRTKENIKRFVLNDSITIRLNNKLLDTIDSESLIEALYKIHDGPQNRSSPAAEKTDLKLCLPQNTITLIMRKDSELPNEFWIFDKEYEIGRINIGDTIINGS